MMPNYLLIILLALSPLLMGQTGNTGSSTGITDSTGTTVNQTVTPMMPTTQTNINPITSTQQAIGTDFTLLPGCPGDPSRTQNPAVGGSTWPTNSDCPNLRGEWDIPPSAFITDPTTGNPIPKQIASCPSTCTSTRTTLPFGDPNPTSIIQAICPAGYVAIATYNSEDDYTTSSTDLPYPAPLLWADYAKYHALNYPCTADTPSGQNYADCVDYQSSQYNLYASRVTVGAAGQYDSAGSPTSDSNGYAGQYIPNIISTNPNYPGGYSNSGICYYNPPGNCRNSGDGTGTGPVLGSLIHPNFPGCSGSDYYVRLDYNFTYISCIRPAGSAVPTGVKSPASIVCSRISTEWRSPTAP